jgi:hypothetical protein
MPKAGLEPPMRIDKKEVIDSSWLLKALHPRIAKNLGTK